MYTVTQTQIPSLLTTYLGLVWFCWYILFSSIVYQFNKSEYLSNDNAVPDAVQDWADRHAQVAACAVVIDLRNVSIWVKFNGLVS